MKTHIIIIVLSAVLLLIRPRPLQNIAKDEGYNHGYKQGQIDAIQGKVKYVLEKKDNGEMIWGDVKK